MDSRTADIAPAAAIAAVVLSAAGCWFAYALHPVWWLAWIAPTPVFAYALRAGRVAAFAAAAVAYLIGGLSWWAFLHGRIQMPVPVILVALGVPALVFGVVALALRAFVRRGFVIAAPFAAASLWTTVAFVANAVSANGTAGHIGYSQMDFLPAIQIAALGGVHAIGFLLMLSAASIAVLFAPTPVARKLRAAAIGAGVVAVALGVGAWRLADTVAPTLKVAALAIDDPGPESVPKAASPQGTALVARYVEGIAAAARAGAKIVLVPENIVTIEDADAAAFDAAFGDAARTNGVDVVVGAGRSMSDAKYNRAWVYDAAGAAPREYTKRHLVPGLERQFTPGKGEPLVVDAATARWAVSICKDLDFPDYQRNYGLARAGLMVVPAWDFIDDAWLHNRMAVLRSVENGSAMLRTARQGLLTVNDDRGRVLASVASDSAPLAMLVADAPTTHRPTWYSRIGDAFSYAAAVLFVVLVVTLVIAGRRRV